MNYKIIEIEKNRVINLIYFFGSAIFFYTQLNIILKCVYFNTINLKEAVIALIFFKIGEFIHEKFDGGNSKVWILSLFISAIVLIIFPKLVFLYFVFSLSMMKIRDAASTYSNKSVKIYGRALGFIIAPINFSYASIPLVILFITIAYLYRDDFYKVEKFKNYNINRNNDELGYLIMGTHHAHYFVYAYTIPFIFAQTPSISYTLTGLLFFLGWAAYNAYEKLLKPKWIYFILGHLVAAFSLLGLYFLNNTISILICWFLTGLGGGTIYMLPELLVKKTPDTKKDLRISEAIGHLVGITMWGLIAIIFGLKLTLFAGCILSSITVLLAAIHSTKPNFNKV